MPGLKNNNNNNNNKRKSNKLMGTYVLIGFLFLYGIMNLVDTKIPGWVLGVTALAAAGALIISAAPWRK